MFTPRTRVVAAMGASLLAAAASVVATVPAQAAAYAPAETAKIHPGTMMYTAGAQCTANFVFRDGSGRTYVGYAAHCAGKGEATDTDGCETPSLPLGTKVTFAEGGNVLDDGTRVGGGTLAYSSWLTMQKTGERNANACAYNDFALVRVNAADVGKVNPSVPFWGGPTGLDTNGTDPGDQVWTYGNSSLRGGVDLLSPHTGTSLGDDPAEGGWTHPVYTAGPGVPGDSGSGFLSAGGKAVGVLSTLAIAPFPASNGVSDLAKELAYAQARSGISGLRLVNGTEPFSPVL